MNSSFISVNRQVLTDLQQKVNYLQTNLHNQQPVGTGHQVVGSNTDPTILNELRETIRQIKSETNTLLQKTVFYIENFEINTILPFFSLVK
jgi:hypothetical protein